MRHLPAQGRRVSRRGGGAGLPIGLGSTGPGGGPRGAHECGAKRGPWGGELQGELKAWGGEGVEEGAGGLVSSGWVSMASGSEGGTSRVVG